MKTLKFRIKIQKKDKEYLSEFANHIVEEMNGLLPQINKETKQLEGENK